MSVNNCQHCGHKQHSDDGWCYMFRVEPKGPCAQHTIRAAAGMAMRMQYGQTVATQVSEKIKKGQP